MSFRRHELATVGALEDMEARILAKLEKSQEKISMDISKLSEAFTTFAGDFGKFKTDLAAFLGTLTPQDPAQQASIDAFTAQLGDMDTAVQGMDASLKPKA
jgi:hypothetical protein